MKLRSLAGLAGLVLALLLAPPAWAGPTVSVRIIGEHATLLERTVTLPDTPPPASGCEANEAGNALEVATGGNWDRQPLTNTILGETHDFSRNDFWAEWIHRGSGYVSGRGVCEDPLDEGDELLMVADVAGPNFEPTRPPLDVEGVPRQAQRGSAISVTVVEYWVDRSFAVQRRAVGGATVQAGSASAVTDGDGRATLVLSELGTVALRATRPGNAPAATDLITVGDAPPLPAVRDTTAPVASILGIRDGQRFTRRRAPRELSGTVSADPSGLWAVKIRLTRRHKGTCWYFSGSKEQFLKRTCGKQYAFKVGDQVEWSYLLPARLPRGRYVLDTYAIDNAFNHGEENRVVFRVR
jgi:hypothetical protein